MAIGWGDGCDGLGLHCSGISHPKVILVGGFPYGSVTVRGGGCTRLVGFAGTDGTCLLPEASNALAAEHVETVCNAAINNVGFVMLGSRSEEFNIENEPDEDA